MAKAERSEIGRKVVHLLYGLFLAGLSYIVAEKSLLVTILTVVLIAGAIAIEKRNKIPFANFFLVFFGREKEPLGRGPITFTLGAIAAILLFEKSPAIWGIIFLAVGDSFATVAGIIAKKPHAIGGVKKKSWEGFVAFVASTFFIGFAFSGFSPAKLALAAVFSALAEISAPWELDDNLIIPTIAALFLS